MTELLLLLGRALPEEHIIDEIKKYAAEYSITKSEDAKKHLSMNCMLFLAKEGTEKQSDDQVIDTMKKIRETERIRERLNIEKA